MQDTENEITNNDIKSAICSCGAEKAPILSSLSVRHLRNSGVSDYLYKILTTVLRSDTTPTNWDKSLMAFFPKTNNPYYGMLTGVAPLLYLRPYREEL
jgi:hypothetical protein